MCQSYINSRLETLVKLERSLYENQKSSEIEKLVVAAQISELANIKTLLDDHECNEDFLPDVDLCSDCHEHAGFCSVCELSNCCGSPAYL